jgi:predicted ATPase/DNA-binding SARP family transcriptional activator
MNVRLKLLGRCTLRVGQEERSAHLRRTSKGTAILALLLLAEGRACEPEYLRELLWPEATDLKKRDDNFRQQLSRARSALGPYSDAMIADSQGIRLELREEESDLGTFLGAIARHDWERAIEVYGGPLLPGCADAWADEARERLRQALLDALAGRADEQALTDALVTLERWQREAPESQEPQRRRWECLVRLNRQAQALAEASAWCAQNDPEPETCRLLEKLRRATARKAFPPLPAPWTQLIGRERELGELLGPVRGERLVTLHGEGGIGKTHLVLELARRLYAAFEEQIVFIDLSGLPPGADTSSVWAALEQACEEPRRSLGGLRALLILDNVEHVLTAVGEVAGALLGSGRELQLLLTSRQALGYRHERRYRLHGLRPPEARELFLRICSSDRARLESPEEEAALERLCTRLEGWPLAIELVASRREVFPTLAALEENLEAALLTAGATPGDPTVPERARTLEATLEWSARQLDAPTRRLWSACKLFVGGVTPESLAGVASVEISSARDALARLTSLSLVRRGEGERCRLLEPIRTYLGPQEASQGRFANHFLCFAETAFCLEMLEEERTNLLEAGAWLLRESPGEALRLGAALWRWWHRHGSHRQGLDFLEQALAATGECPARTEALLGAGALAYALRNPIGEVLGREALERACVSGDERLEARAWLGWGLAALAVGEAHKAADRSERAEALFSSLGDARGVQLARGNRALAAEQAGDLEQALLLSEQTLSEFEASGSDDDWLNEANNLAHFLLKHGRTPQAARWLETVLPRAWERSHRLAFLHGLQSTLDLLEPEDAATLTGGLDHLRRDWGLPLAAEVTGQDQVQRWRREAELGEAAWKAALNRGALLSPEELLTFTRQALKKIE